MDEQRGQRRIWLKLSAVEATAQRWEETLRRDDFTQLAHFGVADVELRVTLTATFKSMHYAIQLQAQGRVQMECDRCARLFWLPLAFKEFLIVRRGDALTIDGDEWEIPPAIDQIDLMPYAEESMYLELPMRHYHGMPGSNLEECDAEMLAYIQPEEASVASGLDEEAISKLASLRGKMNE